MEKDKKKTNQEIDEELEQNKRITFTEEINKICESEYEWWDDDGRMWM